MQYFFAGPPFRKVIPGTNNGATCPCSRNADREVHLHKPGDQPVTIHFISGQAADEKLFENLTLPAHLKRNYVHWVEPLKHESLSDYCKRLSQQIDTSDDLILIGVSLGGIVAVELNKIIRTKQTIIISSISTRHQLRPLWKFIGRFNIHKLVPAGIYKWYSPLLDWYFGAQNKREKNLLRFYAHSTTKNYMKWAVNEILTWKNETRPPGLYHIHGTKDRIFPCKRTDADVLITGGTHLMVHNRADEVSRILLERLNLIS